MRIVLSTAIKQFNHLRRLVQVGVAARQRILYRPRAGGLTRNRLQGKGRHDGWRVTRQVKFVVPRNFVIHLEV